MNKLKRLVPVLLTAVLVLSLAFSACSTRKNKDKDTTDPVEVTETLLSIDVNTSNAKTEYFVGDDFSANGLVVTASIQSSDKDTPETKTLNSAQYTLDKSAYSSKKIGTYTIGVSYTLGDVTKTSEYSVEVMQLSAIINSDNAKTLYLVGEEFSSEGLTATATLTRESGASNVEVTSLIPATNVFNNAEEGTYKIPVTVSAHGGSVVAYYPVTVIASRDGLNVTLADDVEDTIELSASKTSASISTESLVVKKTDNYGNVLDTALTSSDYTVKVYDTNQNEVADTSSISVGGAYQIWAYANSDKNENYQLKGFALVYILNDVKSIEAKSTGKFTQVAGNDEISSTWEYTVTYANGATATLSAEEVDATLDTKTVGADKKATVSYTETNCKGTKKTVTCEVAYSVTEATESTTIEATANISTLVSAGTLSEATYSENVKLADGITLTAESGKTVSVDKNTKSVDGLDFTHRLKLAGAGSATSRSIKIEVAGASKITVYMMSSSSSEDRSVGLYDSTFTLVEGSTQAVGGSSLTMYEYTASAAGIYYIAAVTGGTNVYYVNVVTTIEANSTPSSSEPVVANISTLVSAGTLSEATYSENVELADCITLTAESGKTVAVDKNTKSIDGYDFTHRLKLAGAGSATSRSIKIEATGASKITVYMMSSSSSEDRSVGLYDSTFTLVEGSTQSVGGSAIAKYEYTVSAAGTYYIAAVTGGTNVYCVVVTPNA
jgi:hypothetical protein